jgi:hypothetical protein
MMQTGVAERSLGAHIVMGAAALALALAIAGAWLMQRRIDTWLDEADARALDESADVLEQLVAQQGKQLAATVALLSEDTRIRAMVLTPTFDRATVVDLLTDLRATSGAGVVAMLDSDGAVRAVVGAPELDQLDLGTSSLVRSGLDNPSAQLWAFGDQVGVLSAAAVRLDSQVRAMFMMGYPLDDAVLASIERTIGATGAVFVGERIVAAASRPPEIEQALRAAAALPPGRHLVANGRFLAANVPLRDSAVSAASAWLVRHHHRADGMALVRALAWGPAALLALLLAIIVGLRSQLRTGPRAEAVSVGQRGSAVPAGADVGTEPLHRTGPARRTQ